MAELGMHPRLAHMVLAADKLGLGATACELAALLSDRDPLRGTRSIDMRLRLQALNGQATGGAALDDAAGKRIAAEAKEWMRAAGIQPANAGSARQSGQPGHPGHPGQSG